MEDLTPLLGRLNFASKGPGAAGRHHADAASLYAGLSWVRVPLHRDCNFADIGEKLRGQRPGKPLPLALAGSRTRVVGLCSFARKMCWENVHGRGV